MIFSYKSGSQAVQTEEDKNHQISKKFKGGYFL